VFALRRNNNLPTFIPAHIFNNVHWIEGNVLDIPVLENAMMGMDVVIHAAAKVSFVSAEQRTMYQTNIDGTANIVNAALSGNVSRLVHISSVAALGRTVNGETVDETKKWEENKINTNYAISKFLGEMEVWRGIGEGLNAVIVNPSTVLGYGDWNNSSSAIFKNVYNEFPWYSNGINGFVDVEDVAKATLLLMESEIGNQRFILNADNWSFRQLFNAIADGFGKPHPHKEATPALAGIAWRLEKIKSVFSKTPSLLTKESARIAQTKTYFDNRKILKALPGFAFTPLESTIQAACNHYLQSL
jgi:nucleoside-diphosphate-sugar epimerase